METSNIQHENQLTQKYFNTSNSKVFTYLKPCKKLVKKDAGDIENGNMYNMHWMQNAEIVHQFDQVDHTVSASVFQRSEISDVGIDYFSNITSTEYLCTPFEYLNTGFDVGLCVSPNTDHDDMHSYPQNLPFLKDFIEEVTLKKYNIKDPEDEDIIRDIERMQQALNSLSSIDNEDDFTELFNDIDSNTNQ